MIENSLANQCAASYYRKSSIFKQCDWNYLAHFILVQTWWEGFHRTSYTYSLRTVSHIESKSSGCYGNIKENQLQRSCRVTALVAMVTFSFSCLFANDLMWKLWEKQEIDRAHLQNKSCTLVLLLTCVKCQPGHLDPFAILRCHMYKMMNKLTSHVYKTSKEVDSCCPLLASRQNSGLRLFLF